MAKRLTERSLPLNIAELLRLALVSNERNEWHERYCNKREGRRLSKLLSNEFNLGFYDYQFLR